jgi:hypothetical protein
MSKVIHSPVKKWPGTVTLQDPMLFPAYMRLKDALEVSSATEDPATKMSLSLPGVCACVEKWELAGLGEVTPDTFPASPLRASAELFSWLMGEVVGLLSEAEDIPNA